MLIKKKNGCVLRVSLLFQSPPQSLILLAIPLNPCCVQTTPSKVRAPLEQSLPSTSVTFRSFYFCFSYFSQIINSYFHPVFFSQTIKLWKSQVGFFVTLFFIYDLCTVSWFNPVQTSPSYHCCFNTIYLLSLLTKSTDVSCFTHVNNLQQMFHAFPFCCR